MYNIETLKRLLKQVKENQEELTNRKKEYNLDYYYYRKYFMILQTIINKLEKDTKEF